MREVGVAGPHLEEAACPHRLGPEVQCPSLQDREVQCPNRPDLAGRCPNRQIGVEVCRNLQIAEGCPLLQEAEEAVREQLRSHRREIQSMAVPNEMQIGG